MATRVAFAPNPSPALRQPTSPSTSTITSPALKVHVIFLYHPLSDVRHTHIPLAIIRRLLVLYGVGGAPQKNVQVGQIRYGWTRRRRPDDARTTTTVDTLTIASPASRLAIAPMTTVEAFARHLQLGEVHNDTFPSYLTDTTADVLTVRRADENDGDTSKLGEDTVMGEAGDDAQTRVPCLADGLVAAMEMFARCSDTVAPVARYLVHVIPESATFDLQNGLHPHSNLNSAYDTWEWQRAANDLGKMSAWPSTVTVPDEAVTVYSGAGPSAVSSASMSVEGERVHKTIADSLPSNLPSTSDVPSILGPAFRQGHHVKSMLLSGFSEAAATAARAAADATVSMTGRKRAKKSMQNDIQSSTSTLQSNSTAVPIGAAQASAAAGIGSSAARPSEVDRQAMQKVTFLQHQQQVMMRNVAILKQQEDDKGAASGSPTRHRLLDQFKEQLKVQHNTLLSHANKLSTGSGVAGDLNVTLAALIAIDKEASERGMHLGGPGNVQALVQRHRQQQLQQQQKQQQQQQQQPVLEVSSQAPAPALASQTAQPSTASAAAGQTPIRRGQPFWTGAITWSMALPNKQRNQAATFVTAQCAPNTQQESLLLPWPQRFTISEVQTVSLSAMQAYATTNSTPCIMFYPRPIPSTGTENSTGTTSANQTNETMYMMLARMIDSKKGCAYIKFQDAANTPAEAGIVVVPTAPPGGGNARRLLGLVFRGPVPWHLFAPQQNNNSSNIGSTTDNRTQASIAAGAAAVPQIVAPAAVIAAGQPTAVRQAPQALFQQQTQQQSTPLQPPHSQVQAHVLAAQQPIQSPMSVTGVQPQTQQQRLSMAAALGNLNALSAAQIALQLPAWARQQVANGSVANTQTQAQPHMGSGGGNGMLDSTTAVGAASNPFGTPGNMNPVALAKLVSTTAAAGGGPALGTGALNIDFQALANQLNLATNRSAPSQQQQQQQQPQAQQAPFQQPAFDASMFNQAMWKGHTSKPGVGAGSAGQTAGNIGNGAPIGPSAADLEALQRIFGLNNG